VIPIFDFIQGSLCTITVGFGTPSACDLMAAKLFLSSGPLAEPIEGFRYRGHRSQFYASKDTEARHERDEVSIRAVVVRLCAKSSVLRASTFAIGFLFLSTNVF
jgi:hypothetical protein